MLWRVVGYYAVRLTENALPPTRMSSRAAGIDVRSAYDVIPAAGGSLIRTDLAIQIPAECYGQLVLRYRLAPYHHIVMGGVTDEDYRGHLYVNLFNHPARPFQVFRGDYVAHLTYHKIFYPNVEMNSASEDSVQ